MQLKKFDFEKGEIVGKSGKVYKVTNSIAMDRWADYLKWEQMFYYGISAHDYFKQLGEAFELLNKSQPAKAAVLIDKIREKIARIVDKKHDACFMLAAIFLNEEDEELKKFDESLMTKKIEDWGEYDAKDFFHFAANIVPHFIDDYNEILKNSSLKKEANLANHSDNSTKKI